MIRGYLLSGNLVVVGQVILLCATGLALLAANAHRGIVQKSFTHKFPTSAHFPESA
jgi:hypothetical protein